MKQYRAFFGLQREPFVADLDIKEILLTPALQGVQDRINYAIRLGAIAVITGEIGSGKSTALRYTMGNLHPSEFTIIYITATSGSILELYRMILSELGVDVSSNSRAVMTGRIKREIVEITQANKNKIVLVIDEASLLRLDVFTELHTLTQYEKDSKPFLPIIMAGQINLVDNMRYRNSMPLASRVVGKTHLEGTDRSGMEKYLTHHLTIAGVKQLFEDAAITAIHQGSGGLFRKANHLARGAIIAAAKNESTMVDAEHVRLAATEIF